jgi:hypothetical protein
MTTNEIVLVVITTLLIIIIFGGLFLELLDFNISNYFTKSKQVNWEIKQVNELERYYPIVNNKFMMKLGTNYKLYDYYDGCEYGYDINSAKLILIDYFEVLGMKHNIEIIVEKPKLDKEKQEFDRELKRVQDRIEKDTETRYNTIKSYYGVDKYKDKFVIAYYNTVLMGCQYYIDDNRYCSVIRDATKFDSFDEANSMIEELIK